MMIDKGGVIMNKPSREESVRKEQQDFDAYCVARGKAIKDKLSPDYSECIPLEEGFSQVLESIRKSAGGTHV